MKIGELIKQEIKNSPYTQKQVAKMIGISETSMSQIVVGTYKPTQKNIDKICKALRIRIGFSVIARY